MKKIAPCVLIKVITTKPEQNTKEQPYGKDYNTDSRKFHQKDNRKYKQRENARRNRAGFAEKLQRDRRKDSGRIYIRESRYCPNFSEVNREPRSVWNMSPYGIPPVLKAMLTVSMAGWVLILPDNFKETIFLANRSKTAHR